MKGSEINVFKKIRIANNDKEKRRPVKKVTKNFREVDNAKKERFIINSTPVKASLVNRPGAFGDFIWKAYLLGQWRDVPQEVLVERAAQGIVEECKRIGKQSEGEEISKRLLEVKYGTRKQIWQCCAHLYSLESFLYKKLNETLRLVNSEEHKEEWRSRLETLGLFAWFLFDFPQGVDEFEGAVYRGAQLRDEQISACKRAAETGEVSAFPTFISTSRNRSKSEQFGNTLFIIPIVRSRETSIDISDVSKYPEEEEHLLIAGFLYKVTRVELDRATKKHHMYLQDCNNL